MKIYRIKDIAEIINGGTPSTSVPSFWDGDVEWLTPKDMGQTKIRYVTCGERRISVDGVEHSSAKVLPPRSVILSSRAPIGYVAINTVPMATNQGCKGLILSEKILSEYLFYFLLKSKQLLNDLGAGATFKELSGSKLGEVCIPLPSLAEQRRIVGVLDAEFGRIDALKGNAERSRQNAKDLFQAALKKELEPREGWVISTLQQLLKLTSGDNLTAKSIVRGGYPVYGGNGVIGYHNRYNLDGQNVIVGRVGALCGNVRLVDGKIWYTDNAFLVHDKTGLFDLGYLRYLLTNANLRQYATQAAQPVVSNVSMKDVVLSFPSTKEEQQAIVSRLNSLDTHCKKLQENYGKTAALCDDLKQALLRKAFSGEL